MHLIRGKMKCYHSLFIIFPLFIYNLKSIKRTYSFTHSMLPSPSAYSAANGNANMQNVEERERQFAEKLGQHLNVANQQQQLLLGERVAKLLLGQYLLTAWSAAAWRNNPALIELQQQIHHQNMLMMNHLQRNMVVARKMVEEEKETKLGPAGHHLTLMTAPAMTIWRAENGGGGEGGTFEQSTNKVDTIVEKLKEGRVEDEGKGKEREEFIGDDGDERRMKKEERREEEMQVLKSVEFSNSDENFGGILANLGVKQDLPSFLLTYSLHPDKDFARAAIRSLVKRVLSKPHQLNRLVQTIVSRGSDKCAQKCIKIKIARDGRLQVRGIKFRPHLLYAKIFRWPNVHKEELGPMPSPSFCDAPYSSQRQSHWICVNPYHYERIQQQSLHCPISS